MKLLAAFIFSASALINSQTWAQANNQPAKSTQPPAVHAAGSSAINEAAIGVKTRNGEILLGSPVVGFDGYEYGLKRLLTLLLLKSNPEIFTNPASTLSFVSFLEKSRQKRYLNEDSRWIGRDQFERDDTRNEFLKAEKDYIFGLIPKLPLNFVELRPFGLGDYDRSTRSLDISFDNHDPIPLGPWTVPRPYSFPSSFQLPEQQARQLVKQQTDRLNSRTESLTAAARYQLRDVRHAEGKVILDLVALDLVIYGSRRLDVKIATIPLPGLPDKDSAPSTRSLPLLDPLLPRLLISRTKPELVANASFVNETFRIRRMAERRMISAQRHNGYDETSNWPRFMSPTMLKTNAPPTEADLSAFKTWMEKASASLSDTIRFDRVCSYSEAPGGKPRACNVGAARKQGGQTIFRLRDILDFNRFDWGYADGSSRDWINPASRAGMARVPGSTGASYIPSGGDIPTIIVASSNTAWLELTAPFDLSEVSWIAFEFAMIRSEIIPDEKGNNFLMIEIDPRALIYQKRGGAEQVMQINPAPAVSNGDKVGTFDVLGVKLGMPLNVAVETLQSSVDLSNYKRFDESRPNDPIFANAVTYDHVLPGNERVQQFKLFYDPAREGKPIVAFGRHFSLKEQKFGDDSAARKAIAESLVSKFNAYDQGDMKSYEPFYWATNKTTKLILKSGMSHDHRCSHSNFQNFYEKPGQDSYFRSAHVTVGCGEMLSAKVNRETMWTFLFNGDVADNMRRAVASKAPEKIAPPPIKF